MSQSPRTLPLPNEEVELPSKNDNQPAVELIRQKVANIYSAEPPAEAEEAEIKQGGAKSKHQYFVEELMASGKTIAEIQTAWHDYYQSLTDEDKRAVWQEFYDNNQFTSNYLSNNPLKTATHAKHQTHQPLEKVIGSFEVYNPEQSPTTIESIKQKIIKTSSNQAKLKPKHHLQSLLFGISMGCLTVLILMFGFFNERFIAPFITPSKSISSSPIIVDPTSSDEVSSEPKIIIPKINLEVPVVYDVKSIDEKAIADGLLRGVLHYPTSATPGQNGNVVVVGHSSNNIFNQGKYKFAFVLLSRLETGDTFMLNYNSKRFIYRVYDKKIVKPTDVSVLNATEKTATATLITCDPPGTAMNRLVVVGEQISPSSNENIAANPNPVTQPEIVPGNAESLFHRLFSWLWD